MSVVGSLLAGIRRLQVRVGHGFSLDATFGAGVMALGLSLLLVEQLHHHWHTTRQILDTFGRWVIA